MKAILLVGTGSFIGGILRYIIASQIFTRLVSSFPYGTLLVNLIGCFAIGIVFGLVERTEFNPEMRLFLMGGVLGGFTTFSAFTNESVALIHEGNYLSASIYVFLSVGLGILFTLLGIALSRQF